MPNRQGDGLVSTKWLGDHLNSPDIKLVDATWFMPDDGRDARNEYERKHIPGAVYFDIDEIADATSSLPHMAPDAIKFSARMRKLGLGDGSRVVVYDNNRLFASARVWWMFRRFGHTDVVVLDGGLAKWELEGRALDELPRLPAERHFTARENTLLSRDLSQMRSALTDGAIQIIDARSPTRFRAMEPEPRPGLRAGHIPGSYNIYYRSLLNDDGTMLDRDDLTKIFGENGIRLDRPIVTTCGSGVSAAILNLALYQLGVDDAAMYDGSWTEWGSQADTPIET
ncbi:MAG: 3-mercaptopyruvate sulfurtransferase [Geminicoccaceae bacterium]